MATWKAQERLNVGAVVAHQRVLDVLGGREDGDVVVTAPHHRQVRVAQLAAPVPAAVLPDEVVVAAVQRVRVLTLVAVRLRVEVRLKYTGLESIWKASHYRS